MISRIISLLIAFLALYPSIQVLNFLIQEYKFRKITHRLEEIRHVVKGMIGVWTVFIVLIIYTIIQNIGILSQVNIGIHWGDIALVRTIILNIAIAFLSILFLKIIQKEY